MPQYLQELPLSKLSRLSKIFSDAAAVPKQNGAPFSAAIPEQAGAVNPQQPGLPASPPIPRTRYIQKELDASPRHHQQPHNVTLFLRPVAPTPPAPRVNAPRFHPVPPPRVRPRISARLAVAAPRVDPHQPAPQVTTTQQPTGPDARTRSKNTDFLYCGARGHIFVRNTQPTQLIPGAPCWPLFPPQDAQCCPQ